MLNLVKGQALLSRFSLIELLGEGGMGQVWLVRDLELQVYVAIKVIHPKLSASAERIELLKNECRNTRRLVHPNIVRVYDFHRTEDLAFISMEYIEGQDLGVYRRHLKNLTYPNVIDLLQPIVDALSYAHDLGLVHRDVKAANVLMERREIPRLTDFGVAGIFKTGVDALNITSGGSLYSMSPQQLEGHQPHPSDDIYALGVLMYELLTGYPPFYPDITREKIRSRIPPTVNEKLEQIHSDIRIPSPVDDFITQMLQKDPEDRPSDMQAISEKLQSGLNNKDQPTIAPIEPVQNSIETVSSEDTAAIITPLRVQKKDERPNGSALKQRYVMTTIMLMGALVFMLIGGGWLWHYLSKNPLQTEDVAAGRLPPATKAQQKTVEPQKEQLPTTVNDAQLAVAKKNAEQKLADFLEAKGELDRKGVSEWGGQGYTDMTKLGQEADSLFMEKEYPSASEMYARATSIAGELAGRTSDALTRLLAEGQTALNDGDGSLAQQKFASALRIDASNPIAQRGLQRAKTIKTVMQVMESAKQHEKNNNLASAHTDYREALRIDPFSQEARQALNRVQGRIDEEHFQQLISEGLAAFYRGDYRLAQAKLLSAKSFHPDSREVLDALAQVDQAIRLARIDALGKEAQAAEQAEDWQKALTSYLAVLTIDKNVQFANRGKERALEQIRIAKRIQFFLTQPDALQSDNQLKNAVLLLNEAREIASKGPRLATRLDELEALVKLAQTPVTITIESDNLTEVAVYRVGKLGKFSVHDLKLRPGSYTVVGARDGYKDVRQEIVVKPGQESLRITVKCRIKI